MHDLLDDIDRWQRAGHRIAVARVVDIEGSGPRDPGAAMAVTDHGEVAGSATGCFDSRGGDAVLRYSLLRNAEGQLLPLKVEGIACGRADGRQVYVVLDGDDPDAPSTLCELRLDGPWPMPLSTA